MPIHVSGGQVIVPGEFVAEGSCEVMGPHIISGKRYYAKVLSVAVIEKPKRVRLIPLKRRYIPTEGDLVVGKIIDVGPTYWLVDINSPYTAFLQVSEVFPRPAPKERDLSEIFQVGDLVAAKVLSFDFSHDPLLTVKESKLGKIEKGLLVEVASSRVSRVIGKKGQVIDYLRSILNVELIVGRNGRVVVMGSEPEREALAAYVVQRLCAEPYVADPLEEAKKLLSRQLTRGEST
ncbi:MAG: exosome complex RNA-binding protein Rrp4 [Thermofilaceae archaeon]|nr:exosome complex RNA-binding protein Rrp4 [Thermofilaceae archaeon]MDW8004513.1 exosome complex RNA-binding protein Rrp4 [Thermofilaceae archaeon]